jgi:NAD(P)-dependent dehydrogenase (short-subunit alcohol dehydrogenase family)
VRELVDQTVARFGRLDAAVNTAGTEGRPGPVTEQSADSYAATFDTNVLGTLLSMKHELRVMLAQGSGSIINISSTYGHLGARGASVYSASKHAVEELTQRRKLTDLRPIHRTNAIDPVAPLSSSGAVIAHEAWITRLDFALPQITTGDLDISVISQLTAAQLPLGDEFEPRPVQVVGFEAAFRCRGLR